MRNFSVAVAELGGTPISLHQSRLQNSKIFSVAKETSFGDSHFSIFEQVDAVLDVFAYQPVVLKYQLPEEQMNLYRAYMGNLFKSLMKVSRFTQIRVPTIDNAEESILEPDDYLTRMTSAYDIDYDKLRTNCEEKIEELKKANEIVIHTGEDCNIRFVTKGRKWIADCGDGDLPCGEVYIAPIEEATNGTVFYDKLNLKDIGVFDKVTLTIENGILTSSNNEDMNKFITSLSKEARVICELGFGMNENITSLCGYALLDEKMNNMFHIGIGNNTMFGGKNNADLHVDFVGSGRTELIN